MHAPQTKIAHFLPNLATEYIACCIYLSPNRVYKKAALDPSVEQWG
jgi:hypothetical protein